MTTVVNQPSSDSGSGMGAVVMGIVLLLLGFLFVFYALPRMRQGSTPSVNVPGKIDVNVNTPNQSGGQ